MMKRTRKPTELFPEAVGPTNLEQNMYFSASPKNILRVKGILSGTEVRRVHQQSLISGQTLP